MMTLPPIGPGGRIERRSRARRASDRVQPERAAGDGGFAPQVDPAAETDRRGQRRGGRRASDRIAERQDAGRQEAGGAERSARAPRAYAPLVAQVIANVLGLEQTRVRRRGSLADAEALYRPSRERPKRPRGEA